MVLGAGISGLAAARMLAELGHSPAVIEACPSVGGLTRSVVLNGYSFDYTGHLLHLSRHDSPADLPFAGLKNDEWQRVQRRSYCLLGGTLVPAPVQYHVGALPGHMRAAAIASFDVRPPLPLGRAPTFREFVVSGFGEYLAEVFLIPQNEKTMAISLDRLAVGAVKRFFPAPDEALVRAGMSSVAASPQEYNSRFWYPRTGGIERLVHGLARGLTDVSLLDEAVDVALRKRVLRTRSGSTISWERLLTSVPMREFCRLTHDPELEVLASELSHSSTICINLGIRGQLGMSFGDAHWIYVPDRGIPFYRAGAYSNISRGVCPPGGASLYVEVGVPAEAIDEIDLSRDIEPRVVDALYDLGWVRRNSIVCTATNLLRCAYVHHTPARDRVVAAVLDRLARHDVFPIGRYGTWDYTSMEDSIMSGIETARRVAG